MTMPSYYDIIKGDLLRLSSGDPSSQFLDFGGINKNLSSAIVLLTLQLRFFGDILGYDWTQSFCDDVERYMLTIHGRARDDTLEALKLIYASIKKDNPIQSAVNSATGQRQ